MATFEKHTLRAALRGGQVEIVQWLLEQGADVTSRYGGYYWRGRYVEEVDAVTLPYILKFEELYSVVDGS